MNITDLLIIYLSVGAPFGVYSYIRTRAEPKQNKKDMRPIFAFFFWLPYAARLIFESGFFDKSNDLFAPAKPFLLSGSKQQLSSTQKQLEKFLIGSQTVISIYEFREIIERYAALTIAARADIKHKKKCENRENEFFRIAGNKNNETAAKCFNRRNRRLLSFHQTSARKDFLNIVDALLVELSDKRAFADLTAKFIEILNDSEAWRMLKEMSAKLLPEVESSAGGKPEKVLWKPEIPEPSPNHNSI